MKQWGWHYFYVWDHPIKIQTNCFWVIVAIFGPRNSSIIENILVVTCRDEFYVLTNSFYSQEKNNLKILRLKQYAPHVGDDITTWAPGKYLSMSAAASRREPVPERPWMVATWIVKKRYISWSKGPSNKIKLLCLTICSYINKFNNLILFVAESRDCLLQTVILLWLCWMRPDLQLEDTAVWESGGRNGQE